MPTHSIIALLFIGCISTTSKCGYTTPASTRLASTCQLSTSIKNSITAVPKKATADSSIKSKRFLRH